jgi:hypothetical protein
MKTTAVRVASSTAAARRAPELRSLLAQPAKTLTSARVDAITRAALSGGLTTAKLKAANAFMGSTMKSIDNGPAHDAAQRGGTQMQILWWAMPRDFSVKGSGLSVDSWVKLAADDDTPHDLSVAVRGKAQRAFNLTFTVGEARLSVAVPKGAPGSQVAGLVAAAISKKADDIVASFDDKQSITDMGDNDDLNGIAASAKANVVSVAPEYDS